MANPNNPTGTWFNAHALDEFLSRIPERVIVVLDEAYVEYVEESHYPNGIDRLEKYPNLVVTRTFSKIYGLAGLRIGYGVSSPQIADVLNRVRQPFNVNTPAQVAAEAALPMTITSKIPAARTPAAWCRSPKACRRCILSRSLRGQLHCL